MKLLAKEIRVRLLANATCVFAAAVFGAIAAAFIQLVIIRLGLDPQEASFGWFEPVAAGAGFAGALGLVGVYLRSPIEDPVMSSRIAFAAGLLVVIFGVFDDWSKHGWSSSELTFIVTTVALSAAAAIGLHGAGSILERRLDSNNQAG
jgi:hypothetical protein